MYEQEIGALQEIIDESKNIVFFGGAGVSTESGIPDFRSEDGLYHEKYSYPPERIISHSFFLTNPEVFYRFYKEKMLCLDAEPNAAHRKLAELEQVWTTAKRMYLITRFGSKRQTPNSIFHVCPILQVK